MSSDRRLHPFSIIFVFVAQIRMFVVPGVFVYFGIGSRDNDWWQPWMMLLIFPAIGIALLRYLTFHYRYEPSELVIRTGLIFRKERHIPYARIQNIDAVQNVLHRLFNVIEIKIETGSGQTAEATMSVLPLSALAEMRERVFAERHAVGVTDTPPLTDVPPLLQLDVRELLLCGLIENRGAVVIAAAFGLIWELGLFDRLVTAIVGQPVVGRGSLRNFLRGALSSAAISWARIALTFGAFAGLLLVTRIFSMGWAVVRLYGFRLRLVDDDARTEFGLLTRVAMTIPLRRIQSLTIREGPLHRFFERVAIKVDTAGGKLDEQHSHSEREYLAPLLRSTAVDEFVRAIVGISVAALRWRSPHARAFRREVKRWLVLAVVMSAGLIFYLEWYASPLVLVLFAWAIVAAWQTVKHLGWVITEDAVLFKSGWLWRRVVVVRFSKIQTVTRYENPFDRRNGMARIYVDTAGASEGSRVNIPYLAREDADALFRRLSAEAAQHQFKW